MLTHCWDDFNKSMYVIRENGPGNGLINAEYQKGHLREIDAVKVDQTVGSEER